MSEEREKTGPAFAAVRGPQGDHFHLKGSVGRGGPTLAHGIALEHAQEAKALVAVEIEPRRAGARSP